MRFSAGVADAGAKGLVRLGKVPYGVPYVCEPQMMGLGKVTYPTTIWYLYGVHGWRYVQYP